MLDLSGRDSTLNEAEAVELEQAVDRFEDAWQHGQRPSIEAALEGNGSRALLIELVHVELEYRLKAGEAARVEEYLQRYPELAADAGVLVELLAAEYRHRRAQEPTLAIEEYSHRFPNHQDALVSLIAPSAPALSGCHDAGALPGTVTTLSHYRIRNHHARGGLADILVARQEELGREVAIKLLQAPQTRNPESLSRFLREAEITSQLEHPGVVPVYGLGQLADGTPVYAMRFIQGESLQEAARRFHQAGTPVLDRNAEGLAFRQLLSRFVSVCNTVAYAHSRGILHRDLKPDNIMLGPYGETLVVDWGLAKALPESVETEAASATEATAPGAGDSVVTLMGTVIGTPAYISPEQAAGRWDVVGPASDVYSLGATLYVLLTGRPPFPEGDLAEVLRRVQQGTFPPPRQVRRDVPPALEAVCLRAMALRPEQRYPSALALAADVEKWLAGEPVSAFAEPLWMKARRWLIRHTALAASGAVGLIAATCLAAITVLLMAANDRERHGRDLAEANQEKERSARQLVEVQLALADRDSYFQRITAADRDWWAGRHERVRQRLEECKPGLRRWEYHYLRRRCEGSLLTLRGHQEVVWIVAIDRDGKHLASASLDGTVRIWEVATGHLLRSLGVRGGPPVWGLAFSADGRLLAAGGADHHVHLWDAVSGQKIRSFERVAGEIRGLAFSPDGRLLAAATSPSPGVSISTEPGEALVWETNMGRRRHMLKGHVRGVHSVAFRPDGLRLCTGSLDGTIKVWDAVSGKALRTLEGHRYAVYTVAYSPDGKTIASASGDYSVRLWDADTGVERFLLRGHQASVWGAAFSPDGRRLASSSDDRTVRIWDVGRGRLLRTLHGHAAGIANVAFHPDGRRVVSASDDHTVRIWDATRRDSVSILADHDGPAAGLAFTPDGKMLAVAVAAQLRPDGAHTPGEIRIWDVAGERTLRVLPGTKNGESALALSPDGTILAAAAEGNSVQLWNPRSGVALPKLTGHTGKVWALAFSPDGRLLASAAEDQTVRIWDVALGRALRTLRGHQGIVRAVCFHPDGRRLLSGGEDRQVKVWEIETGQELRSFGGHATAVLTIALSPNGKYLASGSHVAQGIIIREPGVVKVWELESGREVQTLDGHGDAVTALAFSPDGTRLATASRDGSVKLWEPETGQEILMLDGPWSAVCSLTFAPDGGRLVSGREDGSVVIWNGTPAFR